MTAMTLTKSLLASAVLGAAALAVIAASSARAQEAATPSYENEKCYGISKAGKNDCQNSSGSCAGTAAADNIKDAWIYLPAGTCEKIVGGMLSPA